MPVYIVHPKGRNADAWQRRVTASSAKHAIAAVLRDAGYNARVMKNGEIKSNVYGGGDGGMTARLASTSRRPNPRRAPKRKRPSARACSSRGHRLRVQSTTSAGRGLRACRSNPSSGYVVKVTGRKPFVTDDYTKAVWHAKKATASKTSAVKATLYHGGQPLWIMRRGQVDTFF